MMTFLLVGLSGEILADHEPGHGDICGGSSGQWICGEILVKPIAGGNISEIVARQGGSPTDILKEMDLGEIGSWFVVAVPVGHEPEAVVAYLADPDVSAAELNAICDCFLPPIQHPPGSSPPSERANLGPGFESPWLWFGAIAAVAAAAGMVIWRRGLLPKRKDRTMAPPETDGESPSSEDDR